jgi:glutamate-1-semialdehyde 2,1-aminomutase
VAASAGVPREFAESTLLAAYNDAAEVERLFEQHGKEIAAVIVEPVAGNMGYVEPVAGFLETMRALCDKRGALLVFDEVMTGFRVAWGGYQLLCGVRPDITCLGKVIGGGMPVGAYGGSRALMKLLSPVGPVYQAGTLSGNPVTMAAGIATLELCAAKGFYDALGVKASRLAQGLRRVSASTGMALQAGSCGGMLGVFFAEGPVRNFADAQAADHKKFARFFQAMMRRGVWLPPSGYEAMFVSAAHDVAIIDEIVAKAADAMREIE